MRRTARPVEHRAAAPRPSRTCTTLTTTAASPGHFTRRVARRRSCRRAGRSSAGRSRACRPGRSCSWRSGRRRRPSRSRLNARRKKCATRSALPCAPSCSCLQPVEVVRAELPPLSVFLPANGGLPTIASKPGFSRSNTSGNSISQWNGASGCSAWRSSLRAMPRWRVGHAADDRARVVSSRLRRRAALVPSVLPRRRTPRAPGRRRARTCDRAAPRPERRCRSSCIGGARRPAASRMPRRSSSDLRRCVAHQLLEQRQAGACCRPSGRPRSAGGESPTSESPWRSAWSTKVNAWSRASVTSQSDSLARSTATGFLSTP